MGWAAPPQAVTCQQTIDNRLLIPDEVEESDSVLHPQERIVDAHQVLVAPAADAAQRPGQLLIRAETQGHGPLAVEVDKGVLVQRAVEHLFFPDQVDAGAGVALLQVVESCLRFRRTDALAVQGHQALQHAGLTLKTGTPEGRLRLLRRLVR